MKTTKMSLASIKSKLSRAEMKKIMGGGSGDYSCDAPTCEAMSNDERGTCVCTAGGQCVCVK